MNLEATIVILPCQSLEDLSLSRSSADANELLTAWSALYHPRVLAALGRMPTWGRAVDPPRELAGQLFLLPCCAEADLPQDWIKQAESANAVVFRDVADRDRLTEALLETLEITSDQVPSQLTADFHALGFCHFQVELLTRQLRYMSNLDEAQFEAKTLAAATAAVAGDRDDAKQNLQAAFDLLTEAREYFYPVETHLLDLTLVAPNTIGESLRADLTRVGHTNLLISGETVDAMARLQPETLAVLRQALEDGRASLIGGEFNEMELPLLPPEAALEQFTRGRQTYQKHLGHRPSIFGRRRFGLTPALPGLLNQMGFSGAFHFTLDDGRFPKGNQSKVRWEGISAESIDAMSRLPLDAARSDPFLSLPEKLGDVMDLDHAATALFAHWPGQGSRWYEDLRRMADYSPVLGRFAPIADYFKDTQYVGQSTRYSADQYRSPYLRQDVADRRVDPISRWVRFHRRQAAAESLRALASLTDMLDGRPKLLAESADLLTEVDSLASDTTAAAQTSEALDDRLADATTDATGRLSKLLSQSRCVPGSGYLVVNPQSSARRVCLDVSKLRNPPEVEGPIRAAAASSDNKHAVVDVPPMGFAWVKSGLTHASCPDPSQGKKRKGWFKKSDPGETPLAELREEKDRREYVLRNEFFQATIDPVTGVLRAIHDYRGRNPRLAQQIAMRLPRAERPSSDGWAELTDWEYSIMAADRVSIVSAGPVQGQIVVLGQLKDRQGQPLAGFVETFTVWRGSRVLDIRVELDVDKQPDDDPWDSYYAMRFAWGDATADVLRGTGGVSTPTDIPQVEAPHFVDVRGENTSITILTGGLPYHRRFGIRKLDTLLIPRGETARTFEVGIGIDLPYPAPAALDYLAPAPACFLQAAPANDSAWLFHVDSKNVLATRWETLEGDGRVVGFRVRLLETEGRGCRVGLRAFRSVASARLTDFQGENPKSLDVQGDRVEVDVAAHGWVQIEARFGSSS